MIPIPLKFKPTTSNCNSSTPISGFQQLESCAAVPLRFDLFSLKNIELFRVHSIRKNSPADNFGIPVGSYLILADKEPIYCTLTIQSAMNILNGMDRVQVNEDDDSNKSKSLKSMFYYF